VVFSTIAGFKQGSRLGHRSMSVWGRSLVFGSPWRSRRRFNTSIPLPTVPEPRGPAHPHPTPERRRSSPESPSPRAPKSPLFRLDTLPHLVSDLELQFLHVSASDCDLSFSFLSNNSPRTSLSTLRLQFEYITFRGDIYFIPPIMLFSPHTLRAIEAQPASTLSVMLVKACTLATDLRVLHRA